MFDIKSRIARAAEKTTTPEAAKLYESLLQLNIEDKSLQKLLVEKLEETELNGADKAFFETEKRLYNVTNMGILESLNRIAASEAYKMPSVRYNVDSFRSEILMRNKPEFLLAESFLTVFKPFLYDETIQRAHTGIDATSQALVEEVSISKAVYELRNFRNNMLFDGVIAKLGQYLQYELGNASSRARLIEELGQFTFDPVVVRVVNELKGIHSKENGSFQIANAQNADSIVENIYSPILVESKGDVFYTAGNFYLIENANLTHINREEVVTMNEAFVELCEFVNSPNVTMKHNEVTIYAGENKLVFKVSEGETPKAITYNAKPVSIESLTTLFMKSAFRPEEAKMVATIRNLWENLDSFVEIEFGKKIKSKAHQGVEANIFRHNGAVYVNKVNPVMNENILYSNLGGKETQTLVLEFMNYDISESFTDLLGAEEKRAKKIERKIKEVMEGITVLEKQKTKIEVAMQDELIAESKDVKTLYNQINTELKTSKAIYNKLNHMLTENCAAPVKKKKSKEVSEQDANLDKITTNDSKPETGSMVMIGSTNQYGKLTTVTNTDGTERGVVMLADGKIVKCDMSELKVVKKKVARVQENKSTSASKRGKTDDDLFTVDGVLKQSYHSIKRGTQIKVKAEDYTSSASHDLITAYVDQKELKIPKSYIKITENVNSPYSKFNTEKTSNDGGNQLPDYAKIASNSGNPDPDLQNDDEQKEDQKKNQETESIVTKLTGAMSAMEDAMGMLEKQKIHNPKPVATAIDTLKSFIETIKNQR